MTIVPPGRASLLAFVALVLGCHRGPLPAPAADVAEVRRVVAPCPVVLGDDRIDDLATYQTCGVPAVVAPLVRNDYLDDETALPDLGRLQRHAGTVSRAAFEAQLRRFVDPAHVLDGFVALDPARNALRPDPVLAPDVEVAFAAEAAPAPGTCAGEGCAGRLVAPSHPERPYRPARRAELLAAASASRPLAGVRIGIDPGHAGGPYGRLEARHVRLGPEDAAGTRALQEGDLTLRTALELRAKLVAAGAEVTLTRDRPSLVHPEPLHALRPAAERLLRHLALDPAYIHLEKALPPDDRLRLRSAVALYAVARQSRFESLRARARALAAARPDLVLSIHYNAAPPGSRRTDPQEVVAMVRGFASAARLYNPYHRWRALEAAFSVEDFDASVHLGVLCVRAMARGLDLAIATGERYPDHLPVRDASGRATGVDAWDGALLRYLDGVALVAEGPFVDHPEESTRLEAALETPQGTPGTRTERYADALASCVGEFVARWTGAAFNPFAGDP